MDRLRRIEAAARRVRGLQKEYFKGRSPFALAASKDAERDLDALLGSQEGLFG